MVSEFRGFVTDLKLTNELKRPTSKAERMTQWMESHAGAQAELAKVRAEGDWVMIKIEMEKKELDATLQEIQMAKAQIAAIHAIKLHERERKDALTIQADENQRATHMAATVEATHAEIAAIKQRDAALADQIRQLQVDINDDQATYLAAKKQLTDQLHECHKQQGHSQSSDRARQSGGGAASPTHVYKKKSNLSWLRARNKVCLVKRTESLEQKKHLLDTLLHTSKLPHVHVFWEKYHVQEADKAALCVDIERQASENAAMKVKIQQLEAEKIKLQGHDLPTMEGLNPYCQVTQKVLSKIAHECATHNGNWQQSASLIRLLQSRGVLRPRLVKFPPPLPTSVGVPGTSMDKGGNTDGDDDDANDDENDPRDDNNPTIFKGDDPHLVALHSKELLRELRERHAAHIQAAATLETNRKSLLAKSKSRRRISVRQPSDDNNTTTPPAVNTTSPRKTSRRPSVVAETELASSSMMIVAPPPPKESNPTTPL
ncbi:hypothetical protein DYB25_003010 [Aphanomyces astaci]|uniref:Uncharacterized protein n=2 Tax=Aphanomyces astaci TaxID=112090 RepID=A0A396ZVI6_APHAT|nr:hypothetical protein DYB25_003010 [Aphanomyces astaci]RHY10540.1 hypothetical protein DYB36_001514 [Aphanomyces astaci]RHY46824.1 hypothetical protein DYB34_011301 [Aphanomyces astaci]RHY68704.1 hypothetical protein DYB30_004275 [Aphanomyces astaci]RHZ20047.1 hypothetical protein DYB26_005793 [Aphanomyces astaci]